MYKIKQIPEDFIVIEVNNELKKLIKEKGNFTLYKLTKKNYNTQNAISTLSKIFNIPSKFFNFAGTKDKIAITEQFITIHKGPEKNLEITDIKLEFLGYVEERLNLGNLDGNQFIITIRNIKYKPEKKLSIPNYFDSQRFGKNANNESALLCPLSLISSED